VRVRMSGSICVAVVLRSRCFITGSVLSGLFVGTALTAAVNPAFFRRRTRHSRSGLFGSLKAGLLVMLAATVSGATAFIIFKSHVNDTSSIEQ
jgi:hypothetical protein